MADRDLAAVQSPEAAVVAADSLRLQVDARTAGGRRRSRSRREEAAPANSYFQSTVPLLLTDRRSSLAARTKTVM